MTDLKPWCIKHFIRSSQIHSKYVHTHAQIIIETTFHFFFIIVVSRHYSIETTKLIFKIHIFSKQCLKNKISRKLFDEHILLPLKNIFLKSSMGKSSLLDIHCFVFLGYPGSKISWQDYFKWICYRVKCIKWNTLKINRISFQIHLSVQP